MGKTAKVTSKGQVTIPKEIRDRLDSEMIEFEIEGERVIIRPVRKIAGVLKRYADSDLISREDNAWERAVKNKLENR
jgi:AbrB family looped-hinge helix DNA binding protein